MRARPARWALAILACLVCGVAQPVHAWRATVIDVIELPAAWRAHELSGLAWVPPESALMAVSDRGWLWRLPVRIEVEAGIERLRLRPVAEPVRLPVGANGARPNAESLAWRAPNELVIADERQQQALVVDTAGRFLRWQALPGPGGMHQSVRGANHGVEAMTVHPVHGLLAAPQRPPKGADPAEHLVHATHGGPWRLPATPATPATPGGRSALKAMELLDPDTLLVLERVGSGKAMQAVLRPMRLAACVAPKACDTPALRLQHERLAGRDNFEGLACPKPDRCLVVSDDGGRGPASRTMLLLVGIER